ncbi:MAG TPA: hypothetical protein V6D14_00420 [Coleofasciculaceae cyanobacterium]
MHPDYLTLSPFRLGVFYYSTSPTQGVWIIPNFSFFSNLFSRVTSTLKNKCVDVVCSHSLKGDRTSVFFVPSYLAANFFDSYPDKDDIPRNKGMVDAP